MIKRRSERKGHSLVCWFERMMEFGDASDDEAPPPNPKKRELMKSAWLQMISMLQAMDTDDDLKQGLIATWFTDYGKVWCTCMPQV